MLYYIQFTVQNVGGVKVKKKMSFPIKLIRYNRFPRTILMV